MSYRAPVADIAFSLKHAAGLKTALAEGLYGDLDEQTVDSVLAEAGRFATDIIAPLNGVGDKFGTPFKNGTVTTPPGWKDAYTTWAAQPTLGQVLWRFSPNANGGNSKFTQIPGFEFSVPVSGQVSFRSVNGTSNVVINLQVEEIDG